MTETVSSFVDDSNPPYTDLSLSGKYAFNYDLVRIVDLTIHTVRQAWILLKESLPYELDNYLSGCNKFPEFDLMKKYVRFSTLVFVSSYSVGTMICEVTNPDPPATPAKQSSGKSSKSKSKTDLFAVVIVAVSILPNHSGIGLSVKLLDYTVNKLKEAKLTKVYAIADENNQCTVRFYNKLGFVKSSVTFTDVVSKIKVYKSKDFIPPSFAVMELSIS